MSRKSNREKKRAKALELAIAARAIVSKGETSIHHDSLFSVANNFLKYIEAK